MSILELVSIFFWLLLRPAPEDLESLKALYGSETFVDENNAVKHRSILRTYTNDKNETITDCVKSILRQPTIAEKYSQKLNIKMSGHTRCLKDLYPSRALEC